MITANEVRNMCVQFGKIKSSGIGRVYFNSFPI